MKIGSLLIDMAVDLARLRSDMDQAKNTVDGAMRDMARAAGNLKKLLGGVGAALALIGSGGVFARITSEMTDYEARLARVVGGHDAARAAMGRLNDMALRTYSSFGQTAEGYLQNESALRAMGYSTRQTMAYVETLNNALVVSGAKGERAATVQVALQKAMMLGKLSGDQLNAVIASGGRVAELLAEKLGVTTNQLLELGNKGKITASVIYDALAGNMQKIRKEAEEMPVTILDGFARISTVAAKMVYDFDQSTGASKAVANALVWVADNMGLIVQWGTPVAAALLAIAAPTIISGVLAVATALAKAAAGLALLAVANPLVTLAAGAAAAIAALVVFRDEIKLGADETTTLADLGKAAFDDLAGGATTLWGAVKSAFAGQRDEITKTNTVAADSAAAQEASWLAMVRSVLVAFDAMGGFVRGFFAGWGETIAAVTSATIDRFMGMGRAVRKVLMGDITGALAELQTSAALDVKQIFLDAMDRSFESQKSSGLEARLDQWVASARAASAAAAAAAKNVGDAGDDAGKKITTLAGNIKKAKDEFAELMARLNAKDAGVDPKFAEELAILKKGLDAGRIGMDDYIVTVQRLIGQQQFAKDAAAAEAKAFDDLMAAQDKAREKNEGQIRTARQMLEQIQFETSLLKMNTRERTVATAMRELERQGIVKGTQAYEAYAEQIRAALIDKDTVEATIKAQDEVAEGWKRTSEQIGQQFTDALIQGGASVKEALKRMFQNMVLRPIIQPVMTLAGGIIASFLGGGAMAGQGGAGGGGLGGLLGMASNASSAYSLYSGASAFSAGFTSAMSESALGASFVGPPASAAGGAVGAGANAFNFLGSPMGIAAIGAGLAAAFGLFRQTHKRGDALIGTLGEEGGVHGADIMRKDGFLLGGPDWFTEDRGVSALDKAIQQQFTDSKDAIKKFAEDLGLATDKIADFSTTLGTEKLGDHGQLGIRLDKDGTPLSDQEIQAKIAQAIKSADNELAQEIIGSWTETTEKVKTTIRDLTQWTEDNRGNVTTETDVVKRTYTPSEFARDGEQAIDTLTRLGTSIAAVNTTFETLGMALLDASLAGGAAASSFIDLFGTLDNFNAAIGTYYQNFYSGDERRQKQKADIDKMFNEYGLASIDMDAVDARAQYRALVEREQGRMIDEEAAKQALKQTFKDGLSGLPDLADMSGQALDDALRAALGPGEQISEEAQGKLKGLFADFDAGKLNIDQLSGSVADLVAPITGTGKSAAETTAALLQASGAFAAVTTSAEDAAAAQTAAHKSATDAAYRDFQRAVTRDRDALNAQARTLNETITGISRAVDLLRQNADKLYASVTSTAQMAAAQGMVYIDQAIGGLRAGGSITDYGDLSGAVSAAVSGVQGGVYTSEFDRQKETLVLAGKLSELGGLGDAQLTIEQRMLKVVQDQLEYLDQLSKRADDLVNGTSVLTGTVDQYFDRLLKLLDPEVDGAASGSAGGTSGGPTFGPGGAPVAQPDYKYYTPFSGGTAGQFYNPVTDQDVISRLDTLYDGYHAFDGTGDAEGLNKWIEENGVKPSEMGALSSLYERDWVAWYDKYDIPKFAQGINRVPYDMTARVHKDEAIYPARFNPFNPGAQSMGNEEVVAELRALREQNAKLVARLEAIERNTAGMPQMVENIDQVTDGGNAMRAKALA